MGRNGSGKSSLIWALQGRPGSASGRRSPSPAPTRPSSAPPSGVRTSGWCRRPPPTCSTSRPSPTSARPPTPAPTPSPGPAAAARPARPRHRRRDPPARPLRGAAARAGAGHRARRRGRRCVLLDEPTRGLDYAGKRALARSCADLAADGHAVLLATHDVEFAAHVADEVVVLAEGEVVSAGPPRRVLAESPSFAPAGHQGPRAAVAARRRGRGRWPRSERSTTSSARRSPPSAPRAAVGRGARRSPRWPG